MILGRPANQWTGAFVAVFAVAVKVLNIDATLADLIDGAAGVVILLIAGSATVPSLASRLTARFR